MKVDGQDFDNTEAIYGPIVVRRGKKLFAFYAQPVWSYDPFHAICPTPEPPVSAFGKGGKKKHDFKNPIYLEELNRYGRQQWGFMVLSSLVPSNLDLSEQGTPEKPIRVSLDDPETWDKVEQALTYNAETNPKGLSHFEFKKVMDMIDEANLLDDDKMEANIESFFLEAARQEEPGNDSPNGGPESSSFGAPAKDGD